MLDLNDGDLQLDCAQTVSSSTWSAAVAAGCPAAQFALGRALGEETVLDLYKNLGLYTTPSLQLPAESLPVPQSFRFPQRALLGLSEVEVSPLQLALAAATLSAGGWLPPPQIATSLNTPQTGWEFLPPLGEPTQVFSASEAAKVAESLAVQDLPIWQSLALAPEKQGKDVSWYLGGTLPTRPGAPLALAVLLEEGDPALAEKIGQAMLKAALDAK
jgi:hypothetical protein